MLINVPPSISHMSGHLSEFVELMAAKLMVNSHKDKLTDRDIPVLLDRLADEITEFREQIAVDINDPNSLEELSDVANFAFLLYQYLRDRGVKNATERFIEEFYHIDPWQGRVFCLKTRSGSGLKPGDEVRGSLRGGRVHIRAQHAITGAALSVSRADLVWWKDKGRWPTGKLEYVNPQLIERHEGVFPSMLSSTRDVIWNLQETAPKSMGRMPFVSQYRPRGREGSPNYGQWVYQRRFAFKLVRCGYYDTAEDAATQGLKAWKEKTRG